MTAKTKPLLVSCSVLKNELETLVRNGEVDVDLSYYSMMLHSDYDALEKSLRTRIKEAVARSGGPVIVDCGDYCLAMEKMKALLDEYQVTKVDALNCIDCLLGGKGKFLETDPKQECLFLSPGWIRYFLWMRDSKEARENEEAFRNMFSCLKGIVLLDSLGNFNKYAREIEEIKNFTRLPILEKIDVGLGNLNQVIVESIQSANAS